MIPSAVFAEVAEQWLASFPLREHGLAVLGSATDMPTDSWRKRLSHATFKTRKGSVGSHGWYSREHVDEDKVDEFLTAAGLTHLWHIEPLVSYAPQYQQTEEDFASTCADCGTWIDWRLKGAGVTIEIGQMVNVRRTWRWFPLCPRCASYRLPLGEEREGTGNRRGRKIPNDAAHKLYLEYLAGKGLKLLCAEHYRRFGYANPDSMTTTLIRLWTSAGWPMRGRGASKKLNRENGHTRRYRNNRITDETLRKCYELHMRHDLSLNQMGKAMFEKLGYKTHHSCAVAISDGWKHLGLQARDRVEMVKVKCTTSGLSPKDWKERSRRRKEAGLTVQGMRKKRICAATVVNGKRKGERCERPAKTGTDFCPSHDPATAQQNRERLARMRANSPKHRSDTTVPCSLLLSDLRRYHDLFGRWLELSEATGIDQSVLYRQAKRDPDARMLIDTYRKMRDGLDRLLPVELPRAA